MKKLITKDSWQKFFNSWKEMMEYTREIAEKEFDIKIQNDENILVVANKISLKKYIARANGNIEYGESHRCGYCFARVELKIKCKDCIYRKLFPLTIKNSSCSICNIVSSTCMIKRFQNPHLLKLIKEADSK